MEAAAVHYYLSRHISNASFFVYDVSEILPHGQVGPRPERMEMQSASTNNEASCYCTVSHRLSFVFKGNDHYYSGD